MPTLTGGGAERVLATYMNSLDANHYNVHYCSLRYHGQLEELIAPHIHVKALGASRVSTSLPRLFFHIRSVKPDVVVSTLTHCNFACLALKILFPRTKFLAREAIVPSFFFEKYCRFSWPLKMTFRVLYPLADILMCPSHEVAKELKEDIHVNPDNVRILYNPVDVDKIRELAAENLTNPRTDKNVIHFVASGRLEPQKGFHRLIDILSGVSLPYEWRLTILGEGSLRDSLLEYAREKNIADKVELLGWHINPYQFYAQADYFLISSYFEGMPNVALESLACGTPLISIEQPGGIFDIAKRAGPNAVTLVKSEAEFQNALKTMTCSNISGVKPSLLPDVFYKAQVVGKFLEYIQELTKKDKERT